MGRDPGPRTSFEWGFKHLFAYIHNVYTSIHIRALAIAIIVDRFYSNVVQTFLSIVQQFGYNRWRIESINCFHNI